MPKKKLSKAIEKAVFWRVAPGKDDLHRGDKPLIFFPIFVIDDVVLTVIARFCAEKHVESDHQTLSRHGTHKPIVHTAKKGVELIKRNIAVSL